MGREPDHRGKVRDTYRLGGNKLLIVATDRISALDVVLPNGIPSKGEVLARLSAWWFERLSEEGISHHFLGLATPENDYSLSGFRLPPEFHGRSMVVEQAVPVMAECIVRGYVSGSGWKDYRQAGKICGIQLPEGLLESDELNPPIFTPSTKADKGQHDANITYDELVKIVGPKTAFEVQELSLRIYRVARRLARESGIIIADTKFEFGRLPDRKIILIDEVLTPDSSRFWPLDGYKPGRFQLSFDKQPIRDWLSASGWELGQEAPILPPDIVEATTERYIRAYEMLTGEEF